MANDLLLLGVGASGSAAAAGPTLGVAPTSLDVTAGAQSFTLTGSGLTGDATVTAPTDFEVSVNGGSTYFASRTVTPVGGTIAGQTVHVRKTTPAGLSNYSGNVTCSATGATNKTVAVVYNGGPS